MFMNGSTQYYIECFKTSIMNRLIENEAMTLSDQYELYKENIEKLEETAELKATYLENLNKAYDWMQLYINGEEEILLHG